MKSIVKNDLPQYGKFIKEIKELIYSRQYDAMSKVNAELINLYYEIGRRITEKQKTQNWGDAAVEELSRELQKEFAGDKGYSVRNLYLMRNFYAEYSSNKILQPLVAEISWTKNTLIMQKCKDNQEREFYIKMTKRFGWSKNVLTNNLENKAYEKFLLNQTNFDLTLTDDIRHQAKLAVKDEYNFDFIEMGIEHSEHELEMGILNNIRAFLTEMGGDFSYISNQYPLKIDGKDFFIDLLLYHRRLRCMVAIELKIGEFIPEYAGKMQFYLTALDKTIKLPDENNSIGIIICKNKNRTVVEYSLNESKKPIGIATYSYYDKLPKNVKSLLPPPDEIANIISKLDI